MFMAAPVHPAKAAVSINVNIDLNLPLTSTSVYDDCPLPGQAVIVTPRRKHFGGEWTEYQAAYPSRRLVVIYEKQMPRHGWTLVRVTNDGTYYWSRGNRQLRMMVIEVGPGQSIIAMTEARPSYEKPWKDDDGDGHWKKEKKHGHGRGLGHRKYDRDDD
jgi:hypothetical protein